MPKRSYALAEGGPRRLELAWKWNWSQMIVNLDGRQIGGPFEKSDLERQAFVTMPDGATLGLMLDTSNRAAELHVNLDGKPVPGSASHPGTRLRAAYCAIFFIGGLNLVLGIGALASGWQPLVNLGGGIGSMVYGGIFIALGCFVVQRSRVALGVALALYLIDSAFTIYYGLAADTPQMHGIVMRVLLTIIMYRGFEAISDLDAADVLPRAV